MIDFRKVLREINLVLDEVLLFDVILNSVLIFLGFYLGLMLLNFNPWYALFPTLGYFLYLLQRDVRKNKYAMVEDAYKPLAIKLRTAADSAEKENEIVQQLKREVVMDLEHVPVSSFVRTPRITGKIMASVVLCFLILLAAIYNINLSPFKIDLASVLGKLLEAGGDGSGGRGDKEGLGRGGQERDIYGEGRVAELGDEELEVIIRRSSTEAVGVTVDEPPQREFEEAFPDEVFVAASGAFEEKINVENQKLVKQYFKELTKEG